ncbi:MAG: GxxExxY protein [Salibacteraceae bacterium]|nr:GxxExxY protein [Salibacteraceae bacterium]
MNEDELSYQIIGAAIKVHRKLGPGLLEKIYQDCLEYELQKLDLVVEKEKKMSVVYDELSFDSGYRIDLLINKKVVVELKSVEQVTDLHFAQTLTYLKLGKFKLGLIINFNVEILKHGVTRVVNGL